jgi:hypothetical protein
MDFSSQLSLELSACLGDSLQFILASIHALTPLLESKGISCANDPNGIIRGSITFVQIRKKE